MTIYGDSADKAIVCHQRPEESGECMEGGALNIYLNRQKNNQHFKKRVSSKPSSVKSGGRQQLQKGSSGTIL